MRLHIMFSLALLLLFAPLGFAQSHGTFRIQDNGNIYKLSQVSGNRILAFVYANSIGGYALTLFDQNYQEIWSLGLNGGNIVECKGLIELNDGNFLIVTTGYPLDELAAVYKVSATGQLIFHRNYHLANQDFVCTSVAKAIPGDNGFLLGGGHSYYYGSPPRHQNYLVKLDQNGDVAWAHSYASPNMDRADVMEIIADSAGYHMLSFAGQAIEYDAWIWHADALGQSDWAHRVEHPTAADLPVHLKMRDNGDYVLLYDSFDTIMACGLAFIDPQFAGATYRYFYYGKDYQPIAMDLTDDGLPVVLGQRHGDHGLFYMTTFKTDSTGGFVWSKTSNLISGAYYASPIAMGKVPNGNMAISISVPSAPFHAYITELDDAGLGFCDESPFSLNTSAAIPLSISTQTLVGDSIAVTYTNESTTISQTPTYFFESVCGNVATQEPQSSSHRLTIFPNPGLQVLGIHTGEPMRHATVRVYNAAGACVGSARDVQGDTWEMDATLMPSGIYMVEVTEGQNRWVGKWVRE